MTDIFNSADQQTEEPKEQAVDQAAEQQQEGNNQPAAELPEELAELVGEGKKYKSVEDALRSVPHSQEHINRLERELSELREDLDKRLNSEEALKQILEKKKGSEGEETPSDAITPDAIKDLVKSTFNEVTQEEKQKSNIQTVEEALQNKWGEKTVETLKAKAAELGVSVQFMRDTAASSPKAFFNLVGLEGASTKPDHTTAPRHGDVNASAMSESQSVRPNTYRWYQNLRKTNPKQYYDPKMQMQMHRDANKFGDDFYN